MGCVWTCGTQGAPIGINCDWGFKVCNVSHFVTGPGLSDLGSEEGGRRCWGQLSGSLEESELVREVNVGLSLRMVGQVRVLGGEVCPCALCEWSRRTSGCCLLSLPSAAAATQLPAQPEQMPVGNQDFGASLLHTASQVSGVPWFSTPEPCPQVFSRKVNPAPLTPSWPQTDVSETDLF